MFTRIHIYNLHEPCLPSRIAPQQLMQNLAKARLTRCRPLFGVVGRGPHACTCQELCAHVCVYAYAGLHVYFYVNVCIYSREEWLVFLFYWILDHLSRSLPHVPEITELSPCHEPSQVNFQS